MNSVSTMSDLKVRVSYAMQATVVDIYDREGMVRTKMKEKSFEKKKSFNIFFFSTF